MKIEVILTLNALELVFDWMRPFIEKGSVIEMKIIDQPETVRLCTQLFEGIRVLRICLEQVNSDRYIL